MANKVFFKCKLPVAASHAALIGFFVDALMPLKRLVGRKCLDAVVIVAFVSADMSPYMSPDVTVTPGENLKAELYLRVFKCIPEIDMTVITAKQSHIISIISKSDQVTMRILLGGIVIVSDVPNCCVKRII